MSNRQRIMSMREWMSRADGSARRAEVASGAAEGGRFVGVGLAMLVVVFAFSVSTAQYGVPYGYPYGYDPFAYMYGVPYGYDPSVYMFGTPYGYDPSAYMYGMPYGYGGTPFGTGDPIQQQMATLEQQMNAYVQQMNAEMARVQQQLAQFDEAAKARMAEINRYFMELYRTTTGDTASSDEVALFYGQQIHCQRNPVDCQLAAQNAQEAAVALAANNAAFQARMAEQQAGFDARNQQWWADQEANSQANTDWINTVIWGLDDYSSGAGGPTYQLPFAPSQGQTYTSPLGNPMVFDASQNVWYQIGPDGSYTPFYNVP